MKTITVPEREQLSFGVQSILESMEKKMGKNSQVVCNHWLFIIRFKIDVGN